MRAVLQRVQRARVTVNQETVGEISQGWLMLLGVGQDDSSQDVQYITKKGTELRAFNDSDGRMNLSLLDIKGEILVVSQFTLFGDCNKGRRPSFSKAAAPEHAKKLYEECIAAIRATGTKVATGRFGACMQIESLADGPVTLLLESPKS